jgi:type II secretion system protein G
MQKNKQGFTLIELLVVIAIIGLLSTLSILSLNTARARARDAKRIADVKQIQTALEMYYNDVGSYPATGAVASGSSVSSPNGVYLQRIPAPPTPIDGATCVAAGKTDYTYSATNTTGVSGTYSIQYCLGAPINDITGDVVHYATPAGIY